MKTFNLEGKTINIFEHIVSNDKIPVIYLNTVMKEGIKIFYECKKIINKNFIIVEITHINWNKDMSPWYMGPIDRNDSPCLGGADDHLNFIKNKVIPLVNEEINNECLYNIIAGYSLAGLFAFYSLYKTDAFNKAVCCSSSFWFKDFVEFVNKNNFKKNPESIYFSLGDKESKTKNPVLNVVEENTLHIEKRCKDLKIKTTFISNNGGHFTDGVLRMVNGIKWILEN